MPKPPPVTPVYAHVHNAVLQYELARKAFVTTLNDLLAAGDPGQTDALLRAGVVPRARCVPKTGTHFKFVP
jgi:hypothetical protein